MASPRCAHLVMTTTILLLLCHLTRPSASAILPPPPSSNAAANPSAAPPPPGPLTLPRGLPRLIPVWTVPAPVNPFTAKAAFIRYWNRKVRSNRPHPAFFFAKLSPLSGPDAATFSTLASAGKLASRIRDFCAAASLLCPSAPAASSSASSSSSAEGAAGVVASFAHYRKEYQNMSKMEVSKVAAAETMTAPCQQRGLPKWTPEPGKFFRERDLMMGNRMPMPNIADKLAHRAFLPRDIATNIPFEENAVAALFGAPPGSAMRKAVSSTVAECARAPSMGENKRCTTSAEDMVDFAVEMMGSNIAVRTTESCAGSGRDVRLGKITGIAGGGVTRSVSCHQSLFPYLVYYCHSVPRVRLYEVDILDVDSNRKINHGVAICHLETSDWSPNHGAFVALGGKPGEIEVCHWAFEGDMTWTLVD